MVPQNSIFVVQSAIFGCRYFYGLIENANQEIISNLYCEKQGPQRVVCMCYNQEGAPLDAISPLDSSDFSPRPETETLDSLF